MNNILRITNQCTGCTSCANSCPKDAISMAPDVAGFLYPVVDSTLCVDCGKCIAVCPVSSDTGKSDTRRNAYYGALEDTQAVKRSSSGGAFTMMAEYVLARDGVAYGAALDYETKVLMYCSTDTCSLDELRRSKYIASEPGEIFKSVKEQLDRGRLVLFCGLPCHVAGLKRFLKKDDPKLITCDFICGGTASPKFFREHLGELEKRYRARVTEVNFRAKLNGWKEHSIMVRFANGRAYKNVAFYDSFFKGYFEKPYQRNSCYQCQYRLVHQADIIIADYWGGIRKGRCNDTGVSMVITNSEKGDQFFAEMFTQEGHNFARMPLEDSNYAFKTETERYSKAFLTKKVFMELYEKYGFEMAARKTYFKGIFAARLKRTIVKLIKGNRKIQEA